MEGKPEALQNVSIEIGHAANPPEFNAQLAGAPVGATREFAVTYADDYEIRELAGATVDYAVTVKGVRRKELLPLDDDFAKEVSDVETLAALRDRIKEDLQHGAQHDAEHKLRHDLLTELGGRVKAVPEVLVDQEIDRRLEEFVRRLADQGIDPMKAEIDWQEFRERQRQPAIETVKSTVAVDEVARRESIEATDAEVDREIETFAARAGRTPAAVRARLEKDGALARIRAGVRREKTMAWLIEKANVTHG
jgi:trigger factor